MRSAATAGRSEHRLQRLGVLSAARSVETCHQQLSRLFATELIRQQEARETAKHKAGCEAAKALAPGRCRPSAAAAAEKADCNAQAFWRPRKTNCSVSRRSGITSSGAGANRSLEALRTPWWSADGGGGRSARRAQRHRHEALDDFPASRWPPVATSISPSSAMPNCCARHVDHLLASRRAPRKRWPDACTR